MNNSFEIIGKLLISKESEKFKPYTKSTSDSGWAFNKLLFNVKSGVNRHLLESGGMYKEDGTGIIYSFTKGTVNDVTHEKTKGENIQIPWRDRNKQEIIDKVAEFKKFVIDLEKYGRRYELEKALEKQKEGNLTNEEFSKLGVDDLEKALEDSNKKRKVFLSDYDYTEYLHKLITSGKIDDKVFKILGNIVYSEYNGKFYKKLVPSRIYLVDENEPQTSTGQILVFYNKDSLDTASFKDKKKLYINGYARNYDNQRKEVIACPIQLVIDGTKEDEKIEKFVSLMEKQFTVKDTSWKEFGLKVKLLDGSQKIEVTEDMLSDFQKEMLALDVVTMEELTREILFETGGEIYGDKVQEMVVFGVAKGYTKGRKDTVYVNNDFVIKESKKNETKNNANQEENIDEILDLDLDDI